MNSGLLETPAPPWAIPAAEVAAALGVDVSAGLSPADAVQRRARFGANRLVEAGRRLVAGSRVAS